MALSEKQQETVRRMRADQGRIERRDGGFWITPNTAGGDGGPTWSWWTPIATVRCLERLGYVERTREIVDEWRDPRKLTEKGWGRQLPEPREPRKAAGGPVLTDEQRQTVAMHVQDRRERLEGAYKLLAGLGAEDSRIITQAVRNRDPAAWARCLDAHLAQYQVALSRAMVGE